SGKVYPSIPDSPCTSLASTIADKSGCEAPLCTGTSLLKKRLIFNALAVVFSIRSEEHTSELQSRFDLVCRLLLEKKKHRTADGRCTEPGATRHTAPAAGS